MSFISIHENKFLEKISEFTVLKVPMKLSFVEINSVVAENLHEYTTRTII